MLKTKKILIVIFLFLEFCRPVCNAFSTDEDRVIQIYEKIYPAIVSIDAQSPYGISSGTGCIVSSNGGILTSTHVIGDSKDIDVTLNNGKIYKAKIISQMGDDLTLLKIDTKEKLNVIVLGNSQNVKVGQRVLAIGNPFGFSGTLTEGIISRIDYSKNKLQTDAAINPGNSGGPIIDSNGEVIGISQSIYNPDNNKSNIGIGFAVPVNSAKDFIKLAKISKKI